MDTLAIFGLQLVLSLIVYSLLAKWYVTPWLAEKPINQALIPLIFLHAFRHIGVDVFCPRGRCPTPPELFRQHCCLWGPCERLACFTVSGGSSRGLGPGAAVGLDLQRCRHGGPSKCAAP